MLYIFNQDDKYQNIITEETGLIDTWFKDYQNHLIDEPFVFHVESDSDLLHLIKDENQVAFYDRDNRLRLMRIKGLHERSTSDGYIVEVICEPSFLELYDHFVEDRRINNGTAQSALNAVLQGSRYTGNVTVDLGNQTTNFYWINGIDAILKIIDVWGGALVDTITLDENNEIIERKIIIQQRLGADNGLLIEPDYNAESIERSTLSYPVTAMYGQGASLETDNGGYTRYITFEDVEWKVSKGDPVDKPKGQKWVGDPQALQKYGYLHNNQRMHRFGHFSNQDYETPEELLMATWLALQEAKHPEVNHESTINVDRPVSLGDTATIIDRNYNKPIEVQSQITGLEYDILEPDEQVKVVLGKYVDMNVDPLEKELDDLKQEVTRPKPTKPIDNSSFPDVKPGTPVNVEAVGMFRAILVSWEYDSKIYISHYEVFASQTADFVPDAQYLVYRGRVSSFGHEVGSNETWYYRVRAVNTRGTVSNYSVQVSASSTRIDFIDMEDEIKQEIQNAKNKADEAYENANIATQNAIESIGIAQEGFDKAQDALETATLSDGKAEQALTKAQDGFNKAQQAITQSSTAEGKADEAIAKAQEGFNKAQDAITKSDTAITESEKAFNKSVEAFTLADEGFTLAQENATEIQGLALRITDTEGNYTSISGTVQGLQTQVGNIEGNLTTVTQLANGLQTRVSNAENSITTLTQTAEGLQTEVSKKVSTTTYNSKMQQLDNLISSKVSQTDADKKYTLQTEFKQFATGFGTRVEAIEGWEIDGVNLIPDTESEWETDRISSNSAYGLYKTNLNSIYAEAVGDVSVYFEAYIVNEVDEKAVLRMYGVNGTPKYVLNTLRLLRVPTNQWVKLNGTISIVEVETNLGQGRIEFFGDSNPNTTKIKIRKFKMVKGNKPPLTWSPAPEDVDQKFTAINQDIDSISTRVQTNADNYSSISQTVQGIQNTVKDKADKSTVTQLANVVDTKISTTDADAKFATQSQLTQTSSSLTSSINKKVDTSTYDTFVQQTANSLASKITMSDAESQFVKTSSFTQTIDGLQSQVNSKASQSSVTQLAGVVDTKISTTDANNKFATQSQLTQTSNSLNSTIKRIDDIENWDFSATNLIKNSDLSKGENVNRLNSNSSDVTLTQSNPDDYPASFVRAINDDAKVDDIISFRTSNDKSINFVEGETYTLSFLYTVPSTMERDLNYVYLMRDEGSNQGRLVMTKSKEVGTAFSNFTIYKAEFTFKASWSSKQAYLLIGTRVVSATGSKWLRVSNLMLVKGSVASDWQPAIEDLEQQFSTINQTVSSIATQVSKKVDETTYNTYVQQTANTLAAKIDTSTADGKYATITALTATADGIQTEVNKKVNTSTYNSKMTQLDNVIASKITMSDADNKFVTQNSFTQTANSLTSRIENISGRNLIQNSRGDTLVGWSNWGTTQRLVTNYLGHDWIWSIKSDDSVAFGQHTPVFNMKANQKYTISFLIRSRSNSGYQLNYIYLRKGASSITSVKRLPSINMNDSKFKGDIAGDGLRVWFTFSNDEDIEDARVLLAISDRPQGAGFIIRETQIEESEVATQWQPAPEDNYSQFSQLQNAINLRVVKGETIAQINLEAQSGTAYIGGKAIILDGDTTVNGTFRVKNANIASIEAGKLSGGTANFANFNAININASSISGGTINTDNITIRGGSTIDYTMIQGSFFESRGRFTRTWRNVTKTHDIKMRFENGYLRARNDSENSSLYYSDFGISTFADGSGESNGARSSGTIEFFSRRFSNTYNGLTLYSSGVMGVDADTFRTNSKLATSIETEEGLIYLRPTINKRSYDQAFVYSTSNADGNGYLAYGQADTVDKMGVGFRFVHSGTPIISVVDNLYSTGGNTGIEAGDGHFNRIRRRSGNDYIHIQHEDIMKVGSDNAGDRIAMLGAYNRTYSGAANLHITNEGTIGRSTSASKYKLAIEKQYADDAAQLEHSKKILQLQPKTWFDKSESEILAKECAAGKKLVDDNFKLQRHTGLIAEDVERAGLVEHVIYGNQGIESIAYDRMWIHLIPVTRDLDKKVEYLTMQNDILINQYEQAIFKIADLEQRIHELERAA